LFWDNALQQNQVPMLYNASPLSPILLKSKLECFGPKILLKIYVKVYSLSRSVRSQIILHLGELFWSFTLPVRAAVDGHEPSTLGS
jgi:hypothetical protein